MRLRDGLEQLADPFSIRHLWDISNGLGAMRPRIGIVAFGYSSGTTLRAEFSSGGCRACRGRPKPHDRLAHRKTFEPTEINRLFAILDLHRAANLLRESAKQ